MVESCIFNKIGNFARTYLVKIDFNFDCVGDLVITMIPRTYGYTYSVKRAISKAELGWLEDCDNDILYHLNAMLEELYERENE